jgi:hypothetical protein
MAFCSNCGTKLGDGAKFCTNCGAKADSGPAVSVGTGVTDQTPAGGEIAGDSQVLKEYNLYSTGIHILDANGDLILTDKAFKKSDAGNIIAGVLLGISAVNVTNDFSIKVQILKTKICFTRLSLLLRPTESKIEINISGITSVEKTNTFTFKDKTEITVRTVSQGTFIFQVLAKNRDERDEYVNLLLELAGR